MATRSIFRLAKCNPCTKERIFHRFFKTDRSVVCAAKSNAARKISYEANFGAHCRAPHDKMTCEDAYFIWNRNGIAAFGRLRDKALCS
jgi:hypothetical protein